MSDNNENTTSVKEVDLGIDEINALLDIGTGSDTVMLAGEEKKKPNVESFLISNQTQRSLTRQMILLLINLKKISK